MRTEIILIFTIIAYCNCASTETPGSVKDRLLERVQEVETRVKAEIQKLTDEKREHLAQVLQEEETRIETLASELKTTQPGPEALSLLEEELYRITIRVDIEVERLSRESKAQVELIDVAKALKDYVALQVDKLEKANGTEREKARNQELAERLNSQERRVETLVDELTKAQTERRIATIEVELRVIEVRVEEELRRLGTDIVEPRPNPSTGSVAPSTSSPKQKSSALM